MQNHFNVTTTPAVLVNVLSLDMLQSIQDKFECATLDGDPELVLDCVRLQEQEDQDTLRKILELPADAKLPTNGYIVFWH